MQLMVVFFWAHDIVELEQLAWNALSILFISTQVCIWEANKIHINLTWISRE